jgi:hypothetical protein
MTIIMRTRRVWKTHHQQQVLGAAVEALLQNPRLSDLEAIREGQKVLPEFLQRDIRTIGTPMYDWFVTALPIELERAQRPNQEVHPPPVDGTPPDSLHLILTTLVEALKDQQTQNQEVLDTVLPRLNDLEQKVTHLTNTLQSFLTRGWTARILPQEYSLPTVVTDSSTETVDPNPGPPQRPSPNLPCPHQTLPPSPTIQIRKPKVAILNVDSGHTQSGIRRGLEGIATVDFIKVAGTKVPTFEMFDYVIITKWTPHHWIAEAKRILPAKVRLRQASGNADKIVSFIKNLPPIVEDALPPN